MFRTLDEQVMVSEQIEPDQVAEAKAQGVRRIVNNRPDGEAPGQPAGDAIRAAAEAAGLDYVAVPMGHGQFGEELIAAMSDALADGAKTLAFCRSGTRSTILWALARAQQGVGADELVGAAAQAGYDIGQYGPGLATLSRQARERAGQA